MAAKEETKIGGLSLGEKRYEVTERILYNPENKELLPMVTDLKSFETGLHSIAIELAETIKNEWGVDLKIPELIEKKEKRLMSKDRLSREEATEILKEQEISPEKVKSTMGKLFGFEK